MAKWLPWVLGFLSAVALSSLWLGTYPMFGDEAGYGYASARWMADHRLALVPAGQERGEQAMGHPALFFWLWALLMRLLGDTLATARILPTLAAGFALTGTWSLGKAWSGSREGGLMAAAGLLASPLFLAQAFRALPESAHLAATAWSLYHFSREQRLPAALCLVLCVIFRQQGLFLAAAFGVADLLRWKRFDKRLLLWLTPLLVPLVNGLMNLSANGYFLFPERLGAASPDLPSGWLADRTRLFAGHLMTEDFRWLPLSIALAFAFHRKGERPGILFLAALVLPALLYPPARLTILAGFGTLFLLHLFRRRRLPSPAVTAALLFLVFLVGFHVLVVAVAPDPHLNLLRYVFGGYAPLMGLLVVGVRRAGPRVSRTVWAVFCGASLTCVAAVRYPWQPDATVAGLMEAGAVRTAVASVANPYLPDPRPLTLPALGYVSSPVHTSGSDTLHVILTTVDQPQRELLLPPGFRYTGASGYTWRLGDLRVDAWEAVPP